MHESNPQADAKVLANYLDQVTTILPTSEIDHRWAMRVYREHRDKRVCRSEFVVVSDSTLFLIAESPHGQVDPRPRSMLYFWNNYLWPLYTLTLYWPLPTLKELAPFRGYFVTGSKELELLLEKPTRIILLRGQKCISAVEMDLKNINPETWKHLDQTAPFECLREEIGARVFVTSCLERPKTLEQELEYGWARKLESTACEAIQYLALRVSEAKQEWQYLQSSPFAEAFGPGKNAAAELYDAFQQLFWEKHNDPTAWSQSLQKTFRAAPRHLFFIDLIMTLAWFSSKGTRRGREIASIVPGEPVTPIKLTGIAPRAATLFWDRQPLFWPLYYKELLGPGSIAMDAKRIVQNLPVYVGNIDEGDKFFNDLLAEAVTLKRWTIPPGAYVQLELGELVAAKLHEIGGEVACLLINAEGEYLRVWIDPSANVASIDGFREIASAADQQGHDSVWLEKLELAIKILLAAIIRDFWVVEERERVFGVGTRTKKGSRLQSDHNKEVVVYLPRVRYVDDVQHKADALDLVARRAHFVIGHLRKALHASETQIQIAHRYGITPPEGFTFVRPHKRGEKVQERIYRSRSALQCIQALEPISSINAKDGWFQYELNVMHWLAFNGFEVEHLAASRLGDGGVDLQAYRNNEHLLVQCKHWQKEKIGPRIIREMLGTLQTFPEGARGVIITSTYLTEGAKRLAIQNGIQFIQNVDFSNTILSKL